MADDILRITDARGKEFAIKLIDNLDGTHGISSPLPTLPQPAVPLPTTPRIINPDYQFVRPGDTTAYASGDLIANSVTAGSVVPMSWAAARAAGAPFIVQRALIRKSAPVITNASFRVHLYAASPVVTNGDNGAWLSTDATYLGSIDVTVDKLFSNAAKGAGAPATPLFILLPVGTTLFGLLEARAALAPGSGEIFNVTLEILQG